MPPGPYPHNRATPGPCTDSRISWSMPMMPLSGVRISWLMLLTNSVLARLASSVRGQGPLERCLLFLQGPLGAQALGHVPGDDPQDLGFAQVDQPVAHLHMDQVVPVDPGTGSANFRPLVRAPWLSSISGLPLATKQFTLRPLSASADWPSRCCPSKLTSRIPAADVGDEDGVGGMHEQRAVLRLGQGSTPGAAYPAGASARR